MPMAVNLAKARSGVVCTDISEAARTRAAEAGLTVCAEPAAALAGAACVITMLPKGEHVRQLLIGAADDGLLAAADQGALFIDCSTTAPADAQAVGAAAGQYRLGFIDAPVSGGTTGAAAATLSFLCGGSAENLERARPLLAAMGANIFHAGATGLGQAAKICNNMMTSVQMIGTCEALVLGQKMGLDSKVLSGIMSKSSGYNWVVDKYNPMPGVMDNVPAGNNYAGGFKVNLMMKDSDLAMQAAAANDVATPLSRHANALFHRHQDDGSGELDFGSIMRLIQSGRHDTE